MFTGCMERPGLDNIRNATIPKDPTKPSAGNYTFKCHKEYVCTQGPKYGALGPTAGNDGSYSESVIDVFGPDQIPVKVKISEEFAMFNRMYSSVPAASEPQMFVLASWIQFVGPLTLPSCVGVGLPSHSRCFSAGSPNHLFAQTATSCGIVGNVPYTEVGGLQKTFPPLSIYDSLTFHNVSFGIYYNSTCGLGSNGSCYGPKSPEPSRDGVVSTYYGPDVNIDGVWRYRSKFQSHQKFYDAAAAGTLPSFSWISPSEQGSDHPCNDIRKGERQLKDI